MCPKLVQSERLPGLELLRGRGGICLSVSPLHLFLCLCPAGQEGGKSVGCGLRILVTRLCSWIKPHLQLYQLLGSNGWCPWNPVPASHTPKCLTGRGSPAHLRELEAFTGPQENPESSKG